MKALKIVLMSLFIIVVLVVGGFLLISSLAKSDPNVGKYNVQPSKTVITKSIESALKNEEVKLSNQEINEFLAYCINEGTFSFENRSDIVIKNIYTTIQNEDNNVLFYVAYNYKGTDYGLTSNIDLTFDPTKQQFIAIIQSLKIGELKIPVNLVLSLIKDNLPAQIDLEDNKLYFDYLSLSGQERSIQELIKIESFRLSNGSAYIKLPKATNTTSNYLKNLIDKGVAKGEAYINDIFNNITNYFSRN